MKKDRKAITFYIPTFLYEKLKKLSDEDLSSITYHVRKAVVRYLEEKKEEEVKNVGTDKN